MDSFALTPIPSDLEQIAEDLYGDGAWVIAKAASDAEKKKRRDRALQNVAIGTNVVGSVAGPAAIGLAYRSAKKNEGGTPRAYAPNVINRMQNRQSKGKVRARPVRVAGMKAQQAVNALNKPGGRGRAAKIGAAATGGTMIGLQGVNWGGDMLSAKLIGDQKKKDKVAKAEKKEQVFVEPPRVRLVRLGADAAFDTARVAPIVASRAKDQKKVKKNESSMDIHWQGEISKMDTDKRQVFGWASIVEMDGKPVVDLQGDIMTVEEIEKAAYDYVLNSRKGGNQHERTADGPRHVSDLVESFLVTPEKKEQMGLPDSVPTGWWVGFQINDDETWDQVKKGKRTEFSIHGSGTRKAVDL